MRIFISHGLDKTEEDQLGYLRAVSLALKQATPKGATHEILVDDEGLTPGREWEGVLLDCLDECDRALLLLSKRALERPWVWKEATILSFRQSRSAGGFVLYPVLLGASVDDLAKWPALAALNLPRLQAFKGGTSAADVAAHVHKELDKLPQRQATQLDLVVEALRVQLRGADPDELRLLADELGAKLAFDAGTDPQRRCAMGIARAIVAGRLSAIGGLHKLDSRLRIRCGVGADQRATIRELVAPLWVVSDAALMLALHTTGLAGGLPPHALALFERKPAYSGRMLVHRQLLPDLPTLNPLLPYVGPLGDGDADTVQQALIDELGKVLGLDADSALEQLQHPLVTLYVLLPADARDAVLLADLRARFPKLVFIASAGGTQPDELDASILAALPRLNRPVVGMSDDDLEKQHHAEYHLAGGRP